MKHVRTSIVLLSFAAIIPAHAQSQSSRLVIQVIAPLSTPTNALVYVTGSVPEMGEWDPGKIPMHKEHDSLWTFSCAIPSGKEVQFKITRGSWSTEALYFDGVIPQNTVLRVRSDTIMTMKPVTWNDLSATGKRMTSASGIMGSVRYHRALRGEGLRYERDIIVWLPPSYDNNTQKRYPILYMHDGQNVFDPKTSFLGFDWRADEVADSLIKAGVMEEVIIVGINNTPDRIPEYSDTKLGRSYARFVVERLKPMIDSLYRTKPAAQHTAVMGSSMGGLISLLFAWWYPDVFSMAGCLSTAIGPGRYDGILKEILKVSGPKKSLRFYIDVGSGESQLIPGYNLLVSTLEQKGYQKGVELESFFDPGAVHNEIAWSHRLWRPMEFLFGRK